jgi:coenzyme F420-0:L-glutamate ligase/coenzyme F420-1:gamma-L-glutamate ligase
VPGDVLAEVILAADPGLQAGDVLVVTRRWSPRPRAGSPPSTPTTRSTTSGSSSPRLGGSSAVAVTLLITETRHGFVCANSGIDLSNVAIGQAALLPVDSDRSARRIRDGVRARTGIEVGVIISDTFGRTWRKGLTDVALGTAGIAAVVDLRGTVDAQGRELQVTEVCVADELAGAAELVMGKASGVPVAIVRGVDPSWLRESSVAAEIVRDPAEDLFR